MKTNNSALNPDEMYQALLERDFRYDGLFYFGVRTTGVFCRPTCAAKKPLRKNVRFFWNTRDAIASGFRPCQRCQPMKMVGYMPVWLVQIVLAAENDLGRRWCDADLRGQGVDPTRVRRWFQQHHGITFHVYLRSRRLCEAVARLAAGEDATRVAFAVGYESVSGFREAFSGHFGVPPGNTASSRATLVISRVLTPLGPMIAAADEGALQLLEFADRRSLATQLNHLAERQGCTFLPGSNRILTQASRELTEYFDGTRQRFTIPVESPGTEFQRAVWQRLRRVPYGETTTYKEVARAIGRERAVRAVGRANGQNRLAIVVPCHRVVGQDGRLSGYAGGLRRKEWLLAHERTVAHSRRHPDGS